MKAEPPGGAGGHGSAWRAVRDGRREPGERGGAKVGGCANECRRRVHELACVLLCVTSLQFIKAI